MLGFIAPLQQSVLKNETFCRVLHTGEHLQLVMMAL